METLSRPQPQHKLCVLQMCESCYCETIIMGFNVFLVILAGNIVTRKYVTLCPRSQTNKEWIHDVCFFCHSLEFHILKIWPPSSSSAPTHPIQRLPRAHSTLWVVALGWVWVMLLMAQSCVTVSHYIVAQGVGTARGETGKQKHYRTRWAGLHSPPTEHIGGNMGGVWRYHCYVFTHATALPKTLKTKKRWDGIKKK